MHILIDSANIGPHNGLHGLILGFLKQVWPQPLDHNFIVQSLIIKFLVKQAIVFVNLSLLTVDLPESLHFFLLTLRVVLQYTDFVTHLFLYEHVVLHATLEDFCRLFTIFADPSRVPLLV